jgi:hypothetical protein
VKYRKRQDEYTQVKEAKRPHRVYLRGKFSDHQTLAEERLSLRKEVPSTGSDSLRNLRAVVGATVFARSPHWESRGDQIDVKDFECRLAQDPSPEGMIGSK